MEIQLCLNRPYPFYFSQIPNESSTSPALSTVSLLLNSDFTFNVHLALNEVLPHSLELGAGGPESDAPALSVLLGRPVEDVWTAHCVRWTVRSCWPCVQE